MQFMKLPGNWSLNPSRQIWLAMKLLVFFLAAVFFQASATGHAQTVSVSGKNLPLKKVFTVIKKQTGYVFFYDTDLLERAQPVHFQLENNV